MLNSPCNPSGRVYSLAELEEIAHWAHERGVWLVSDEIYRRIYFHGPLAPGHPRPRRASSASAPW